MYNFDISWFRTVGQVADVLGRTRYSDRLWSVENGSDVNAYTCPFCGSAVVSAGGCANPCCTANPVMPVEGAQRLVAEAEARAEAERQRKRNHELAMERIRQENERRVREYQDFAMRVRAANGCLRCSDQYRGKVRRHRAGCPKAA